MHHPTDRITHTTAFVTPVVEHWMEREIAQWVHPMKDRSDDPSHHERTLLPRSYIPVTKLHNVLRTYTELYTCYFLFLFIAQVYFALEYIYGTSHTFGFFYSYLLLKFILCKNIYTELHVIFYSYLLHRFILCNNTYTELHILFFLFLFIAQVYFVQEYIYRTSNTLFFIPIMAHFYKF